MLTLRKIAFLILAATAFSVPSAQAAVDPMAYVSEEVARGESVTTLAPGATGIFSIRFRNAGTDVWEDHGKGFVSIYTYGPKYRTSVFADPSWFTPIQPVKLMEPYVGAGNLATFQFKLKAPATPGTYKETFALAAEDLTWIAGGQFTITINVIASNPSVPASAPSKPVAINPGAPAFQAEMVTPPKRIEMLPGSKQQVSIKLRNIGSSVWTSRGDRFVSVYTQGPKYRTSPFRDASWFGAVQPAKLTEASIEPGGTGTITFTLAAPSTLGDYSETFALAAENTAWIPGGQFVLPVSVRKTIAAKPTVPSSGATTPAANQPVDGAIDAMPPVVGIDARPAAGYKALKLMASARDLTIATGESAVYRVAFKNDGQKVWRGDGSAKVALTAESGNAGAFHHSSWDDQLQAARLVSGEVQPGQLGFFEVTLAAPSDVGSYNPRFVLTADGAPIEGGAVEIPIQVIRGAAASIPSFGGAPDPSGQRGPNVRIGLFKTASSVVVAADGSYELVEGRDHTVVRQLSGVTTVTFDDAALTYTVRNGSYEETFSHHVHLRPENPATTIFEIQSYSSIPTWDPSINFNKFRGELEVHYSAAAGEVWVIEELPLEDYMRGLAETSNGSPMEYQKALVTAARTFAYFVQKTGGKHASKFFDLTTGAGDQVYKGYVSELVRPNVVRAVEETRGMVVTYEGDVAVTPYFSRSDGRTRSYAEVWGKNNPWLVSKPAPYDEGMTLWGHGVGMSASDAVGRADAGWNWQEILKYYYTGIDITPRY